MTRESVSKGKIRVLAFPAFKNKRSNPYNSLLYGSLKNLGVNVVEFSLFKAFTLRYELIHVHWPERYLNSDSRIKAAIGSSLLIFALWWSRLFGRKVVWTVHNLEPHKVKFPVLNKLFWKAYLSLVDGCLSLSKANEKLFHQRYPQLQKVPSAVTYHGLYRGVYPDNGPKATLYQEFEVGENQQVCLFLGRIMPYKNIEALITLFSSEECANVKLIIAGRIDDAAYHAELEAMIGQQKNILMKPGFVKDEDIQHFMHVADVMILPFDKIFNSGSALLGVSFGVTVLVPFSDNFAEYQKMTLGYLTCYSGKLSAVHIHNALLESSQRNSEVPTELEWENIARATQNFYQELIQSR